MFEGSIMGTSQSREEEENNRANFAQGDLVNEEGGLHIESHEMVGGSSFLLMIGIIAACWYFIRRQVKKQRETRRRLLAMCGGRARNEVTFADEARFPVRTGGAGRHVEWEDSVANSIKDLSARVTALGVPPPPYPGSATQMQPMPAAVMPLNAAAQQQPQQQPMAVYQPFPVQPFQSGLDPATVARTVAALSGNRSPTTAGSLVVNEQQLPEFLETLREAASGSRRGGGGGRSGEEWRRERREE